MSIVVCACIDGWPLAVYSPVKCLRCMQTSDTFDPLLDVSLDIKNCSQLTRALEKSTKPDKLDGENRYACPL